MRVSACEMEGEGEGRREMFRGHSARTRTGRQIRLYGLRESVRAQTFDQKGSMRAFREARGPTGASAGDCAPGGIELLGGREGDRDSDRERERESESERARERERERERERDGLLELV